MKKAGSRNISVSKPINQTASTSVRYPILATVSFSHEAIKHLYFMRREIEVSNYHKKLRACLSLYIQSILEKV